MASGFAGYFLLSMVMYLPRRKDKQNPVTYQIVSGVFLFFWFAKQSPRPSSIKTGIKPYEFRYSGCHYVPPHIPNPEKSIWLAVDEDDEPTDGSTPKGASLEGTNIGNRQCCWYMPTNNDSRKKLRDRKIYLRGRKNYLWGRKNCIGEKTKEEGNFRFLITEQFFDDGTAPCRISSAGGRHFFHLVFFAHSLFLSRTRAYVHC